MGCQTSKAQHVTEPRPAEVSAAAKASIPKAEQEVPPEANTAGTAPTLEALPRPKSANAEESLRFKKCRQCGAVNGPGEEACASCCGGPAQLEGDAHPFVTSPETEFLDSDELLLRVAQEEENAGTLNAPAFQCNEQKPSLSGTAIKKDAAVYKLPAAVPTGARVLQDVQLMREVFQPHGARPLPLTEEVSRCRDLMSVESPLWFAVSRLLSEDQRQAIWTLFGLCHTLENAKTHGELDDMRRHLHRTFVPGVDLPAGLLPVWGALRAVLTRYPLICQPFDDFVDGIYDRPAKDGLMTFSSTDELLMYTYRTAGVVGLIALPVLAEEAALDETVVDAAIALGMALRLTSMLACLGHNRRAYGLCVIPTDVLQKQGVPFEESEQNLLLQSTSLKADPRWRQAMKGILAHVEPLLRQAAVGGERLSHGGSIAVRVAIRMCRRVVANIEARDYEVIAESEEMFSWRAVADLAGAVWESGGTEWPASSDATGPPSGGIRV